jgi:hypothetical protein
MALLPWYKMENAANHYTLRLIYQVEGAAPCLCACHSGRNSP